MAKKNYMRFKVRTVSGTEGYGFDIRLIDHARKYKLNKELAYYLSFYGGEIW